MHRICASFKGKVLNIRYQDRIGWAIFIWDSRVFDNILIWANIGLLYCIGIPFKIICRASRLIFITTASLQLNLNEIWIKFCLKPRQSKSVTFASIMLIPWHSFPISHFLDRIKEVQSKSGKQWQLWSIRWAWYTCQPCYTWRGRSPPCIFSTYYKASSSSTRLHMHCLHPAPKWQRPQA